jgi:hypothetical protein
MRGRRKESSRIRVANRAVAAGNLMLGKVHDWAQFLEADTVDLQNLPRRALKAGFYDVKDAFRRR